MTALLPALSSGQHQTGPLQSQGNWNISVCPQEGRGLLHRDSVSERGPWTYLGISELLCFLPCWHCAHSPNRMGEMEGQGFCWKLPST